MYPPRPPTLYQVGARTMTITHPIRTYAGGVIALSCVNHFVGRTNVFLERYFDLIDHVGSGTDSDGGSRLRDDARHDP